MKNWFRPKIQALNRVLQGWILYCRHANVKEIAQALDWWIYRRLTHWLRRHHKWGTRQVLTKYEYLQYGRRKNLATPNERGQLVYLYRMCDLPITQYRTRNYPHPYIDTNGAITQATPPNMTPLHPSAWNGGSRHAEWREHRRLILERDKYRCQQCNSKVNLEVHHLQARHEGGTDDPTNLITLCEHCHMDLDGYRAYFKTE